jgi:hypothetical protein
MKAHQISAMVVRENLLIDKEGTDVHPGFQGAATEGNVAQR